MKFDLTIAIPARNEEKNLLGCLQAIGNDLAKRVVVIDSNSTDETLIIARKWGAEVINFEWDGKFPKKRNWYLRTYRPDTTWVLFVDADEYITEEFKTELKQKLSDDSKVGYWLNYTTYFMGRQLRGGYPLRKLALFRVDAGEYEHVEEEQWSELDMEVHEHPILNGKVGIIRSKIDHQDFRGISNFFKKHNEYASWEARRYLRTLKDRNYKDWTWKQQLKYRYICSLWFPPAFFLGSFFLYGGFKDGRRGLIHAFLKMSYYIQVYCKIREELKFQGQMANSDNCANGRRKERIKDGMIIQALDYLNTK
jgi:glycosyltransferase involved in cell wall biosynthesis